MWKFLQARTEVLHIEVGISVARTFDKLFFGTSEANANHAAIDLGKIKVVQCNLSLKWVINTLLEKEFAETQRRNKQTF
jgi:hypothetical protein